MKVRSRWLGAATGAAVLAAGLAVVPTTASAGAGDTILNPGPFTMTVEGGFMNLAGTLAPLRSSADPARCNDGVNNDESINGGPPQDTNIDWDGKFDSGADGQCNGLNNALKAADDSEVKALNQPKVQITISGEVNADGIVDVTNVVIPPEYLFTRTDPDNPDPSVGGLVLDITFAADPSGTDNGFIDPATGAAELDVSFSMRIVQAFYGIDCTIDPISFRLSNDPDSANNAGPLAVSQSPYNTGNGHVTVSNNTFTIPASQTTDPLSTSNACTNLIDPGFGIPSASGESAAQFFAISDPIAESGISGNTIAGTVTDGVNGLGGIVMTLMDEHDSWTIAGTTITDGSGNYSFEGLPVGNYSVRAFDPTGTYQREWKDDALTYKTAAVLAVTDTGTTNGDMALGAAPAGGITGRAMDAQTNAPISGARVHVFHATDGYVGGMITGADGYFLMQGLPDDQYYVWYRADSYQSKWHMYKMLFFNADLVTVAGDVAWGSSLL